MTRRTILTVMALAGGLAACLGQPTIRPPGPAATPSPAGAPAAAPAPVDATPAGPSLYRRLGGYDALAAVTDDFLARMLGDTRMAAYFEEVNAKGKQRVRQMIVEQLCAATGGPCVYVGADMPTVHKGLQISETAWTAPRVSTIWRCVCAGTPLVSCWSRSACSSQPSRPWPRFRSAIPA